MDDFGVGIDSRDATNFVEVSGRGLLQHHIAVVGVATILRFSSLLAELVDDNGKRHFIGLSDAHVDDFGARMSGHGGALGALNFLEFINGSRLAVLASANAVGKQVLNVRL